MTENYTYPELTPNTGTWLFRFRSEAAIGGGKFVDETGFSFRAKTGTTWAPKGQTPVLRRVSKRRALSTVIGLTLSGRIYKALT